MRDKNLVGPQLRKLRDKRRWSQSKLAIVLQFAGWEGDRNRVAKIEGGHVYVRDTEAQFFCDALGVEWYVLVRRRKN